MKAFKTRDCSVVSETGQARWGELMRKFSQAEKEKRTCKSAQKILPRELRGEKVLPTGATYEGSWDVMGFSGFGVYTFPNGVMYEGEFQDGEFHGEGEFLYESGEFVHGKFEKGKLVERQVVFAEGLEYEEKDWKYCHFPDRRFGAEYDNGVAPATKSFKTFEKPCKWVPKGYYDTGDGFYHPSTKTIYRYDDLSSILRVPSAGECKWIEEHCRKKPKVPTGPRPDLYESWTLPALQLEVPPPPAAVARNVKIDYEDDDDDYDFEGFEWRPARRSTYSTAVARRKSLFSYIPELNLESITDKVVTINTEIQESEAI